GLVEQEHHGVLCEQRGDGYPTSLAAGECVCHSSAERAHVHGSERAVGGPFIFIALPFPQGEMGVAADQYGLQYRRDERIFEILSQKTRLACDGSSTHVRQRHAVHEHCAARGWT